MRHDAREDNLGVSVLNISAYETETPPFKRHTMVKSGAASLFGTSHQTDKDWAPKPGSRTVLDQILTRLTNKMKNSWNSWFQVSV